MTQNWIWISEDLCVTQQNVSDVSVAPACSPIKGYYHWLLLANVNEVLQCDFRQATAMGGVFVCNAQVACKALEKGNARIERL